MEVHMKEERYRRLAQLIRGHAVMMTTRTHSGHVGSCLSMAELVAVLYEGILDVNPEKPQWPGRDRFILSKGHAAAALYGALVEKGFFPREWIDTYYQDGGELSGHISHHVPGVELTTGSLGHGLPVAAGMALAAKRDAREHRIFVLMSEGDCNEGSTWEAAMFAARCRLENLIAIVDANGIQALGRVEEIGLEPLGEKFAAFGWSVREIDGHDVQQIEGALRAVPFDEDKPSIVIARTVKGKGVKHLENTLDSHYRFVPEEKLNEVYEELGVKDAFTVK
jgi:transketolase